MNDISFTPDTIRVILVVRVKLVFSSGSHSTLKHGDQETLYSQRLYFTKVYTSHL